MKHRTQLTAYVITPWTIEGGIMKAPVTLITEGVRHGSHGRIFWAAHILEQNAHKWEGVPVCVDHPRIDGNYVSINQTPEAIIGTVKNPRYDAAKRAIKAQIEIPAEHPQAGQIQAIKEVSMGVFSDETYTPGTFNGQDYSACSITLEPDHLALLPNDVGACDFSEGCGIRNNAAFQLLQNAASTYFKNLTGKGDHQMNITPLLPPGVNQEKEITKEELQTLQDGADAQGILLPTQFNRCIGASKFEANRSDEVEPLLPAGMN